MTMKCMFKRRPRLIHLLGFAMLAANCLALDSLSDSPRSQQVGPLTNGAQWLPSRQILRVAGQRLQFSGRPVDLALSPDGRTVFVKNMKNLLVVDAASWRLSQTLDYPGSGASMHGIAVRHDGSHVYVTGSGNELYDWQVASNSLVSFSRTIALPKDSDPCGLAISADDTKAYVCLSIKNTLAVVDLAAGAVRQQIPVGIAPWTVALSPDGNTAYVSDWGGRFPVRGDLTATSAGTAVVVDARGVASSGVVSFVNLASGVESAQVATGLHPSDLALSHGGNTLFVANANSDTVTIIDTHTKTVLETLLVRPDPTLPFGSEPDGLALSSDEKTLFVASAGNNAVAVVRLASARHANSLVQGFFSTDWYPGAVVVDKSFAYVANVKGLGSRDAQPTAASYQGSAFLGTVNRIPIPSGAALRKDTSQVIENGRIRQIKQAYELARVGEAPAPVPTRLGEPSVFKHVLYILKENKTYDQMFGDMPQGNGDAHLCIYPERITPNHHALARQYVLLDNYYCNGVISADGHSWSTEGNTTDHLEKSFGGFVRSYTFGDDPLTYSSSGFLWDKVLAAGLTFRNYGEMDYAEPVPKSAGFKEIYADYLSGAGKISFTHSVGIANLQRHTMPDYPGWNLKIPDQVRAGIFLKDLQRSGAQSPYDLASLTILYLPCDHTSGTSPGAPTPRAQVADNDLAVGRIVEAISKSKWWPETCIFVNEDDPQDGYDHVDGHRSLCLVVSPYTRRHSVVHTAYNQTSALHTMERILGLQPMNQFDAASPTMDACFTSKADTTPYTCISNRIPL